MVWLVKVVVGSRLGRLVASALGAMVLILGAITFSYRKGGQDQKKNQQIKDLKKHKEVMDEIHDVDINTTRDEAIERLRKNGRLRD